ncbi:MAG: CoA-disulfide reductase [Actinobacteria bacterium]|nr:CoA-disulfide reductase [Actinomycetota bacterium]
MKEILIIGGVAGGMSAATRLRRLDPEASIIVFERSGHVSYANCGLPYFVGGVIEDHDALLLQTPESLHARFRLDVRVNHDVLSVNAEEKYIVVRDVLADTVSQYSYDYLVMSPGALPVVPPLPGIELAYTLRTVEDVDRIAFAVSKKPEKAVVVGGGFIGLETAENLQHRGIQTTLIEATEQVLAPLDPEMASYVTNELTSQGIQVRLGSAITSIDPGGVHLADDAYLPADLVILAIGVKPDISLAKSAGVAIGERGGIQVDQHNRTSNEAIYAIGDAAEKLDALDGSATLVPLANIANRQGRVIADHIMGRTTRVVPTIGTAIVKVFDLTIAVTGWNEKRLRASGREILVLHSHPGSHAGYYPGAKTMALKIIIEPKTGLILGAQGVGKDGVDKRIDVIATAIRAGLKAVELADLELAYAPPFGSAKDPVNMLGYMAENILSGLTSNVQWSDIAALRARGSHLLDVRSANEFAAGSIPGAVNIPIDELRERINEIPKGNVVVLCQVGQRGHTATLLLRELGVDAANLDGGYLTWKHSPARVA